MSGDDKPLTHLTEAGEVHMVDVSGKDVTKRTAVAEGIVHMSPDLRDKFFEGGLAKGDAAAVARIAGIQGAKKTSELVPLCHPIRLDSVDVSLEAVGHGVRITATVTTTDKTGVEMEAITAVSTAAITVYDMVKGVDRGVTIESVRLLEKTGGRSGEWIRPEIVD
jgi:cyclic pyranopterin phosphate synthase